MAKPGRHASPPKVMRRGVGWLPGDRGQRHKHRYQRHTYGAVVVLAALALAGLADVNHVVTPGESLWSIAKKYGTTPKVIATANHIPNPDLVQIGEALRIPGAVAPAGTMPVVPSKAVSGVTPGKPPPLPTTSTHVVAAGENLTIIAAHYSVSPQTLTALNGITNPNLVRVGQRLKVPVPAPTTVEALLVLYSHQFKVDPSLMKALAWQESGWQQSVVSPVGAVGVMQVMPQTTSFTSNTLLQHPVNAATVANNVETGVAFFAYLLKRAGGNEQLAIAGYYQGLTSVKTRGMYNDTKRYVANIEALKQRFGSARPT